MNVTRHEQPPRRVVPAHQGLDAEVAPCGEVDLRLVVQHELVVLDAGAKVVEQREPARGRLLLLGGEHRVARCPPALRCTSPGRRGAAGRRCCPRDREPAPCRCSPRPRCVAVDEERRLERVLDLLSRRSRRRAGPCRPAAGSRTRRRRAGRPCRPLAGSSTSRSATSFSSVVSLLVPERVVDLLEPVEVQKQERQRLAGPQRRPDRLGDAVPEQHPVGKAGEVVVQRLMLQRLDVGVALGDVAHAGDVDLALSELDVAQLQLDRERGPVLAAAERSVARALRAAGQELPLGLGLLAKSPACFGPTIAANGWPIASSSV